MELPASAHQKTKSLRAGVHTSLRRVRDDSLFLCAFWMPKAQCVGTVIKYFSAENQGMIPNIGKCQIGGFDQDRHVHMEQQIDLQQIGCILLNLWYDTV